MTIAINGKPLPDDLTVEEIAEILLKEVPNAFADEPRRQIIPTMIPMSWLSTSAKQLLSNGNFAMSAIGDNAVRQSLYDHFAEETIEAFTSLLDELTVKKTPNPIAKDNPALLHVYVQLILLHHYLGNKKEADSYSNHVEEMVKKYPQALFLKKCLSTIEEFPTPTDGFKPADAKALYELYALLFKEHFLTYWHKRVEPSAAEDALLANTITFVETATKLVMQAESLSLEEAQDFLLKQYHPLIKDTSPLQSAFARTVMGAIYIKKEKFGFAGNMLGDLYEERYGVQEDAMLRVEQHAVGFTDFAPMASTNICDCLYTAFWDPVPNSKPSAEEKTHVSAAAHWDQRTDYKASLPIILREFPKGHKVIHVRIAGAKFSADREGAKNNLYHFLETLHENKTHEFEIISQDIYDKPHPYAIVFEPLTGEWKEKNPSHSKTVDARLRQGVPALAGGEDELLVVDFKAYKKEVIANKKVYWETPYFKTPAYVPNDINHFTSYDAFLKRTFIEEREPLSLSSFSFKKSDYQAYQQNVNMAILLTEQVIEQLTLVSKSDPSMLHADPSSIREELHKFFFHAKKYLGAEALEKNQPMAKEMFRLILDFNRTVFMSPKMRHQAEKRFHMPPSAMFSKYLSSSVAFSHLPFNDYLPSIFSKLPPALYKTAEEEDDRSLSEEEIAEKDSALFLKNYPVNRTPGIFIPAHCFGVSSNMPMSVAGLDHGNNAVLCLYHPNTKKALLWHSSKSDLVSRQDIQKLFKMFGDGPVITHYFQTPDKNNPHSRGNIERWLKEEPAAKVVSYNTGEHVPSCMTFDPQTQQWQPGRTIISPASCMAQVMAAFLGMEQCGAPTLGSRLVYQEQDGKTMSGLTRNQMLLLDTLLMPKQASLLYSKEEIRNAKQVLEEKCFSLHTSSPQRRRVGHYLLHEMLAHKEAYIAERTQQDSFKALMKNNKAEYQAQK